MKYITKTLKGLDVAWDGVVNTRPGWDFGATISFNITDDAVEIYRGAEPEPSNQPKSAIKVHRIELLPTWTTSYIADQTKFMYNVEVIPFISTVGTPWKSTGNNAGTRESIVFSANTNAEWELNAFSGTAQGIPNDRVYNDPFIIHPYESLNVRIYTVTRQGGSAVTSNAWHADDSVVTIRIAYEDYDPNERYYGRVATNDTFVPPTPTKRPIFSMQDAERGYADQTILDFYTSSTTLQEAPFTDLTDDNHFELDSLSFRSGYPFGGWTDTGADASNYMYDIMVRTQDVPEDTYTIRRYMSYTAGNTGAVLDFQELLKGPAKLKKAQQLFVRIYTTGAALGGNTNNQYYYRQAPAFWFNGTVPK
mgnify:FL=1|tara:strand:- start:234 stop:1325 length:1092 start_codon:yes stop_codon:yes gene_type:complete